jgi:hypothetical protein
LDRREGIGVIALGIFLLSFNASVLMVSPSTGTGCEFTLAPGPAEQLAAGASEMAERKPRSARCRRIRLIQRWVAAQRYKFESLTP